MEQTWDVARPCKAGGKVLSIFPPNDPLTCENYGKQMNDEYRSRTQNIDDFLDSSGCKKLGVLLEVDKTADCLRLRPMLRACEQSLQGWIERLTGLLDTCPEIQRKVGHLDRKLPKIFINEADASRDLSYATQVFVNVKKLLQMLYLRSIPLPAKTETSKNQPPVSHFQPPCKWKKGSDLPPWCAFGEQAEPLEGDAGETCRIWDQSSGRPYKLQGAIALTGMAANQILGFPNMHQAS